MILKNCMKDVIAIRASTTVRDAAKLIIERRAGTLPVVDDNETLIGVVRLPSLLKVFMPNFVSLLDNIDFVADFGSLEDLHFKDIPEIEHITMKKIMEKPVLVDEECGLLRAFAIMDKYNFMDLLVVNKEGRLVGIASRVDIAAGFLSASMEIGGALT
ncbi:MAG: CBS domain-containing protein [Candidatus Eremiobacterota bacterium]